MEFGIEKCAMIAMKGAKRYKTHGKEIQSQDKIRTLGEKVTYEYLGILGADTIKRGEMKDIIKKECLRRTRKLLATKLPSRNIIKGINNWAGLRVRC